MTVGGEEIVAHRMFSRLGAGGMGEVWLAEHMLLRWRDAIELLHPVFSQQLEIVTRFFTSRSAMAITDPGVGLVFDFGHHHGSAYITMELLDGETLDARWRRLGVVALGDALYIVRQMTSSLGAAHARGIARRALKPENIFLECDPDVTGGARAKIVGFDIAKLGGDVHFKTSTSAVVGPSHFMSPEECHAAGQIGQRADIYSIGCILFSVVVGQALFDADGAGELLAAHLREPAPRASSRATGVPPEIDDLFAMSQQGPGATLWLGQRARQCTASILRFLRRRTPATPGGQQCRTVFGSSARR